ncbi:MAG: hypothetical protein LIO54_03455 [Oscillospiraceae bacterium]|nr:hypothetical protein [Oscillospiraceae bacterium]
MNLFDEQRVQEIADELDELDKVFQDEGESRAERRRHQLTDELLFILLFRTNKIAAVAFVVLGLLIGVLLAKVL